jgi:hypothetical protein
MARPPHAEKLTRKVFDLPDREWDRVRVVRHALGIDTQREAIHRIVSAGLDALEDAMRRKMRGEPRRGD